MNNKLNYEGETKDIQIVVPENSSSFGVRVLSNSPDKIAISVKSPTGESIDKIPDRAKTSFEALLTESRCTIKIDYHYLLTGIGTKVASVRLINPIARNMDYYGAWGTDSRWDVSCNSSNYRSCFTGS